MYRNAKKRMVIFSQKETCHGPWGGAPILLCRYRDFLRNAENLTAVHHIPL